MGPGSVRQHDMDNIVNLARTADCDVLSMIGVLEHLQKPREVLAAMRDNPRIRYFYMSVPLFSPCVFFEMIFPDIFHRQLSAGHTHLFTESSLDWLCREFGMKRRAEWWFGTDMVDLFRSVYVKLEDENGTEGMSSTWSNVFAPAIDGLQSTLDQRKQSSEVHMLLEFTE